jgi:hypothetical protein
MRVRTRRSAPHRKRAAGCMLWSEVENGTQCPSTLTYGAVPTLARQPEDFREWLPTSRLGEPPAEAGGLLAEGIKR